MKNGKGFLVDVGIQELPFPIKVLSKYEKKGQPTIANISIRARIMRQFEAQWIDTFIQQVHKHRNNIGIDKIKTNIDDYMKALQASSVRISMEYPFFVEKTTPVSKESCLVKYNCRYTGQYPSLDCEIKTLFSIDCPVITTYPIGGVGKKKRFFPQLSIITIELQTLKDVFAEDIAFLADKYSLSPVFSFLSVEDQLNIIEKCHTQYQSSVDLTDNIKLELMKDENIKWYSLNCTNLGMLHNYTTLITMEKSIWVPGSTYAEDII